MSDNDDCVMEMRTVQSNIIKILFDSMKDILVDLNMVFDEAGLKIIEMDGSQVALVSLKLYAENFDYYYCEKRMVVGVNMLNLYKLIKTVSIGDTITFSILRNCEDKLKILMENNEKNSSTEFMYKFIDMDEKILTIPDVNFDSVITMPSSDFQRYCKYHFEISKTLTI